MSTAPRSVCGRICGHSAAVRDVGFTNDGSKFVSCSYDRYLKLWDTETGECITALTNRKPPYCIKVHPKDPNTLLAGCSNKHIVQYDMRSGKVEQVYDQHLGAVNTITFCEENRRFATTADDKKMLIWEFGIPVPIKHIADPTLHSMPAVTKTPNDKWLLCQNLDNQITTYSASDRFKLNRKKTFKGHVVAGYACEPGVSPDGNYVMSGDTDGRLWFWDWSRVRSSARSSATIRCASRRCGTRSSRRAWRPARGTGRSSTGTERREVRERVVRGAISKCGDIPPSRAHHALTPPSKINTLSLSLSLSLTPPPNHQHELSAHA